MMDQFKLSIVHVPKTMYGIIPLEINIINFLTLFSSLHDMISLIFYMQHKQRTQQTAMTV